MQNYTRPSIFSILEKSKDLKSWAEKLKIKQKAVENLLQKASN